MGYMVYLGGGLCLAVALSHRLNKLIIKPIKHSLIVDDVYETGLTLAKYKDIEGQFFVLFSKKEPLGGILLIYLQKQWIVFLGKIKNILMKQNIK